MTGAFCGLAVFGIVAHLLLLMGASVDAWWLPASLLVGGLFAWRQPRQQLPPTAAGRAWVPWITVALLVLVAAILACDVLTSGPRDWDAVAAWSVKAQHLRMLPSLEQPYFEDPWVWHHSRDYPLLQPLCLASCQAILEEAPGRLLFPALYLLMVATVGVAAYRAGVRPELACGTALALGLTPMLVDPTSGGVTSGYGDLFLATAMSAVAAGLLLRDRWLFAAGTVLLVLVKPEGLIYAAVVLAVPWLRGDRQLLRHGTVAFVLATAIWLPLQLRFEGVPDRTTAATVAGAALGVGLLLILTQVWLRPDRRSGWVLVLWACVAAAMLLVLLKLLVAGLGQQHGTLTAYFSDPGRAPGRLGRLPGIAWGLLLYLLSAHKVGLVFVLLLLLVALGRRRVGRCPQPGLGLLLLLATPCLVAPYLLSTEPELSHHLRSSMARLLLHWLGPCWLLVGTWLQQVWMQRQ